MKRKTLFTNIRSTIVLFSVILLIPLFVVCTIWYSEASYNQIYNDKNIRFVKIYSMVNRDLNEIVQDSTKIVSSARIADLYMRNYEENMQENMEAAELMKLYFSGYVDSESATMADIVMYHNNTSMYGNRFSQDLERIPNPEVLQMKEIREGMPVWINEEDSFRLYRRLIGHEMKYEVIFCCTYPRSGIEDAIRLFDMELDEIEITCNPQNKEVNPFAISENLVNGCQISLLSIAGLKRSIYLKNCIFALPLLLAILLAVFMLSTRITSMLTAKMYRFIEGIASDDIIENISFLETDSGDELYPVYEKIKSLLAEIRELDRRRALVEQDKKNIELQYVQSQINPHLLYNSLSILRWWSLEYDEKLADIIDGLSNYYRLSISKPNQVIKFSEEMQLIQKYVDLISFTKNKIYRLNVNFSDELLNEDTFKHILQPFVENSIIHGLVETSEPVINIFGKIKDDTVEITIEDNGMGVTNSALDGINKSDYTSLYDSFGVKNTLTRLKYFYGEDSCISVCNRDCGGAVVYIKFKRSKENQADDEKRSI